MRTSRTIFMINNIFSVGYLKVSNLKQILYIVVYIFFNDGICD